MQLLAAAEMISAAVSSGQHCSASVVEEEELTGVAACLRDTCLHLKVDVWVGEEEEVSWNSGNKTLF
jgi:hypothetical protein